MKKTLTKISALLVALCGLQVFGATTARSTPVFLWTAYSSDTLPSPNDDGWLNPTYSGNSYSIGPSSGGITVIGSVSGGNFFGQTGGKAFSTSGGSFIDIFGTNRTSVAEEMISSLGLSGTSADNVNTYLTTGMHVGSSKASTITISGLSQDKAYLIYYGTGSSTWAGYLTLSNYAGSPSVVYALNTDPTYTSQGVSSTTSVPSGNTLLVRIANIKANASNQIVLSVGASTVNLLAIAELTSSDYYADVTSDSVIWSSGAGLTQQSEEAWSNGPANTITLTNKTNDATVTFDSNVVAGSLTVVGGSGNPLTLVKGTDATLNIGALAVGAGKKVVLGDGVSMSSYSTASDSTLRFEGTRGSLAFATYMPTAGNFEFKSATITGDMKKGSTDYSSRKLVIQDGDEVSVIPTANSGYYCPDISYNIKGGSLTFSSTSPVWFACVAKFVQSGGITTFSAEGDGSKTTKSVVLGYTGSDYSMSISGGTNDISKSVAYFDQKSTINLSGEGVLKVKGFTGGTQTHTITIAGDSLLEVGSYGVTPSACCTMNLNGGRILASDSNTIANPITVGDAAKLAAATDKTMTISGVVSGSSTLTIGDDSDNCSGTIVFSNAANTYSGSLTLYAGVVKSVKALKTTPANSKLKITTSTETIDSTSYNVYTVGPRDAITVYVTDFDFNTFKKDSDDEEIAKADLITADTIEVRKGTSAGTATAWSCDVSKINSYNVVVNQDMNWKSAVNRLTANVPVFLYSGASFSDGSTVSGTGSIVLDYDTIPVNGAASVDCTVTFKGAGTLQLKDGATLTVTTALASGKVTSGISGKMVITEDVDGKTKYSLATIVATITKDGTTTNYKSYADALKDATNGETINIVSSVGAITIDKGVTVSSAPANLSSATVSGAGTLKLTTFPTSSVHPTFSDWTGTVEFPSDTNCIKVNQVINVWGNANSTVRLMGLGSDADKPSGGGTYIEASESVTPTLELGGNLIINNGNGNATPLINKLTGTGNLTVRFTPNAASAMYYLNIGNIENYTGTLASTTQRDYFVITNIIVSTAPTSVTNLVKLSVTSYDTYVNIENLKIKLGNEDITANYKIEKTESAITATPYVAQYNGEKYTDITEAFEDADGNAVTLLMDASYELAVGSSIKVALSGHNLTVTTSDGYCDDRTLNEETGVTTIIAAESVAQIGTQGYASLEKAFAAVTADGAIIKVLKSTSISSVITIQNSVGLNLNKCDVTSELTDAPFQVYYWKSLTVANGTITSVGPVVQLFFALLNLQDANLISTENSTVSVALWGAVNADEETTNTLTPAADGNGIHSFGEVDVTGEGTLNVSGVSGVYATYGDYSATFGASAVADAAVVVSNPNAVISTSSATGYAIKIEKGAGTAAPTLTISAGKVAGAISATDVTTRNIYGGLYDATAMTGVYSLTKEGYSLAANTDTVYPYTVIANSGVQATVDVGTYTIAYTSVQSAVDAISDTSGTVTVTQYATDTAITIPANKAITLSMAGSYLTGATITLKSGASLSAPSTGLGSVVTDVEGKAVQVSGTAPDCTYTVVDAEASFGGKNYIILSDALTAAKASGGSVTLLTAPAATNIEIPEGVTLNITDGTHLTDKTIDGAGTLSYTVPTSGLLPATTWTWAEGETGWTGTYSLSGFSGTTNGWDLTEYYNTTNSAFAFGGTVTGGYFYRSNGEVKWGELILTGSINLDNGYTDGTDASSTTVYNNYHFTKLSGTGTFSTSVSGTAFPAIRFDDESEFTGTLSTGGTGTGYRYIIGSGTITVNSGNPIAKSITFSSSTTVYGTFSAANILIPKNIDVTTSGSGKLAAGALHAAKDGGCGTLTLGTFPSDTSSRVDSGWKGTVTFPATTADQGSLSDKINAWGNTSSTVILNSVGTSSANTGSGKGTYAGTTINPTVEIVEGAAVYLNNGTSGATTTFSKLTGKGTLSVPFPATDGKPYTVAITTLDQFTGTLSVSGSFAKCTISTIALASGASTAIGTKVVSISGDAAKFNVQNTALTVGGTAVSACLKAVSNDGIYVSKDTSFPGGDQGDDDPGVWTAPATNATTNIQVKPGVFARTITKDANTYPLAYNYTGFTNKVTASCLVDLKKSTLKLNGTNGIVMSIRTKAYQGSYEGTANVHALSLFYSSDGEMYFVAFDGNGGKTISENKASVAEGQHVITVVADATTEAFYVDGTLAKTETSMIGSNFKPFELVTFGAIAYKSTSDTTDLDSLNPLLGSTFYSTSVKLGEDAAITPEASINTVLGAFDRSTAMQAASVAEQASSLVAGINVNGGSGAEMGPLYFTNNNARVTSAATMALVQKLTGATSGAYIPTFATPTQSSSSGEMNVKVSLPQAYAGANAYVSIMTAAPDGKWRRYATAQTTTSTEKEFPITLADVVGKVKGAHFKVFGEVASTTPSVYSSTDPLSGYDLQMLANGPIADGTGAMGGWDVTGVKDRGSVDDNSKAGYRIPAIAKATNGVITTLFDCRKKYLDLGQNGYAAIDWAGRDSADNGNTWQDLRIMMDRKNHGETTGTSAASSTIADNDIIDPELGFDAIRNKFVAMGSTGYGIFNGVISSGSVQTSMQNCKVLLFTRDPAAGSTWDEGTDITNALFAAINSANGNPGYSPTSRIAGFLQGPGHAFTADKNYTNPDKDITIAKGTPVFAMQFFWPNEKASAATGAVFVAWYDVGANNALTWHATAFAGANIDAEESSVTFLDDGSMYMVAKGASGGDGERYAFRSTDYRTWTKVTNAYTTGKVQGSILKIGTKKQSDGKVKSIYSLTQPTGTGNARSQIKAIIGTDATSTDNAATAPIDWATGEISIWPETTNKQGYTSQVLVDAHTLGVLFEANSHIYFQAIDISAYVD